MENPTGKLSLVFRRKESGKTYIAKQYFKLPLQIMSPHYQDRDGTAFVYLLNPSGGILQHDRLLTEIEMEENSKALITTPSSTKFYKMDDGYAHVVTQVHVKAGAVLEYLPEHNVPFAQSSTYQESDFHLDSSAVLIASDMVTAGRVSRGEIFDYDIYASKTKIYVDGRLQLYDNNEMNPETVKISEMGLLEGYLTNGTVYAYMKDMDPDLAERINESKSGAEHIYMAAGNINENLLIVRFMGDNMIDLQKEMLHIWGMIREAFLGKKAVRIRKY